MFRYIALNWNPLSGSQQPEILHHLSQVERQLAQEQWQRVFQGSDLRVWSKDTRPGASEVYALPDSCGVVLGTVFEPCLPGVDSELPKKRFTQTQTAELVRTGGRCLFHTAWGRYVALLCHANARRSYVLRDPSGGLPCYHVSFGSLEVVFSSVQDLVDLGLKFKVAWDFITARVAFVYLNGRETALSGVSEILPGEQLQIHDGTVTRALIWDPALIARTNVIEDPELAAHEMRRVTRACTYSWAACYPNLLHKLSGGLDSSIVLSCLQNAPSKPQITCLNYFSKGSDGDERIFARAAAQGASVPLFEWERLTAVSLENLLNINRSPAPTHYLGHLQTTLRERELAKKIGAKAYFGGFGGDQLFYTGARVVLSVADYLRMHGINRKLIGVALAAAHWERRSIWSVLGEAWRRQRAAVPWDDRAEIVQRRTLLSRSAISDARNRDGFKHPLFEQVSRMPPGKSWHAAGLMIPTEFYDPLGARDDPEIVHPLMSQPLVELCLRIPSYVLTQGGWDRAIARKAFRTDVPTQILNRRSKGGMEENVQHIFEANRTFARRLLLDGVLVDRGLLDRQRVDEATSGEPTRTGGTMGEIFDYLCTEAWLRTWN